MRPKNEWLTHDQLVYVVLKSLPAVLVEIAPPLHPDNEMLTETEMPLGPLYADVVARMRHHQEGGKWALIVEVKSNFEQWSAGAVIRQLKGYREKLRQDYSKVSLGFFCDRILTEEEVFLFNHEKVVLIQAAPR